MRRLVCGLMWIVALNALSAPVRIEATFLPDEHVVGGTVRMEVDGSAPEAWFVLLGNLGREPNPYVSPLVRDGTYIDGFDPAWTRVERVTWVVPSGEEEIPFDLFPAPPTLQTYSLEDVLLRVPLPEERGELVIRFQTRFPHIWTGEPGRWGEIYTWRFGWYPLPFSPPEDGHWPFFLPAQDHVLTLAVPEGWDAALPGEVAGEGVEGGTRFAVRFAGPVSSVPLFLAPQGALRRATLAFPSLTVEAVALPGDEDKVRALATYLPEILSYYAERYGPYPERRLLLVEHPNEVGVAMTADGVVFIPRWFFRRLDLTSGGILARLGRYILAHELAHLWWGIGIGVDLDAENWLSEGMAQYLSIRWYEDTYGAEGGNVFQFETKGLGEEVVERQLGFVNLREHLTELPYLEVTFAGFDEAVVKPAATVRYEHVTADRLYDKGYLVLRAMAGLVGEDVFERMLREAAEQARGKAFTVADLRALLEEETGEDWEPFFSQWVYGEAWADYAVVGVVRKVDGAEHVTAVHLARRGTGSMPVVVTVCGPEGEVASQLWTAAEEKATLEFRTPFQALRAVVDPDHRALDVDRLNNTWPRKFVVAMDRLELPLDGYLVEPDVTSAGVTIRYLDRFGWGIYPEALTVGGWVRYGREWAVAGWAALRETLIGSISLTRSLWATPPLGSAGTYWEEVGSLTLALARRPGWTLGVDLAWGETLARARAGDLSLLWVPDNGLRAEIGNTQLLGLFPHTYLTLGARFGLVQGDPPRDFFPTLTEFRTIPVEEVPRGERKVLLSLGVWLPPFRPDYSLGGAALVTEVRPRLYASWARLWNGTGLGGIMQAYLEAGVEAWVSVELLGGLARVGFLAGVGFPVIPWGEAVLYFGFLSP